MKSEVQLMITGDGSPTLFDAHLHTYYHSTHGAKQESEHVFISAGLEHMAQRQSGPLNILELGTGTGLNALLAYRYAHQNDRVIFYFGVEPFPPAQHLLNSLADVNAQNAMERSFLTELYTYKYSDTFFSSTITKTGIEDLQTDQMFHVVFMDAFAPDIQPELWTTEIFEKFFQRMYPGSALVTYCAKGAVRRNMQSAGFICERLPGAKGKREMLRAIKI